ncbi:tropomyosin-2-like [Bombus vosnesenskii]|uniref:Tropomyosin-2-like n=3 Tax=Pyrobombus TaxID=144703 RepID=A0A6J3K8L3_9HYME|nr:tropomyosin-2 [Bombus impatiens]XP_033174548.1 tropomyosin-2 [Bombus impatiens]XP_033206485.1 tropomyosin-2-like [Bombus vancouverensis nearcticus]XP_033206486.1 tropomyosin-2-like [Bombus vancouverensis nearcticus]XP_033316757.1 tropomyosin-2-like [Bombus bifarius]XP_033316758.1 tropomyosin-2-like [Bombus bifarius]XP_033349010.1 tropomyosin-2-like [Bombus vosnesenskii]XP_033349011.1 tropomyosin-2-like [Bombus vosnesenskii]XP_050496988.1 tropomyosin-2-like [Bombus huntii]XP_050496989.1 
MEAIKKKIAALKQEMDAANEKVEANEAKARSENFRADKLNDDVRDLQKKLAQLERDYGITKTNLEQSTADLEQCEKSWSKAEQDRTTLTKRVQEIEATLTKKEELRLSAQLKLARATELADDAQRMCKVLEDRSRLDEERMEKLMHELKDARLIAEDADAKSDEISKKLQFVEEELEGAEERVKTSEAKIVEREDELFIVQNIVKSLEVSEEKANQRVEEFKVQLKQLKKKLREAEKRAVHAERTVKKLLKEVDMKEDELREEKEKYKAVCDDMDATFAEMTGY